MPSSVPRHSQPQHKHHWPPSLATPAPPCNRWPVPWHTRRTGWFSYIQVSSTWLFQKPLTFGLGPICFLIRYTRFWLDCSVSKYIFSIRQEQCCLWYSSLSGPAFGRRMHVGWYDGLQGGVLAGHGEWLSTRGKLLKWNFIIKSYKIAIHFL